MHNDIEFSTRHMDLAVDPFDNFYLYCNGNWLRRHKVPKDRGSYGIVDAVAEANRKKLRAIAEKCSKEPKNKICRIVGDMYTSFMNTEAVERLKFKPLDPYMRGIEDIAKFSDMSEYMIKAAKSGFAPFFDIDSDNDKKESDIYALYIYQSGLSLPDKSYYIERKYTGILGAFRKHVEKMFVLYGLSKKEAEFHARSVLKIEKYLARNSRSNVELRDEFKNYNRFSEAEVEKKFGRIGLSDFYKGLGVEGQRFVVIGQPEFVKSVDTLGNFANIEEIKAYLRWSLVNDSVWLLHNEAYDEDFNFRRLLLGIKKKRPRWKRAIGFLNITVGEALGQLYIKQNFSEETRRRVAEMVEDIKETFRERLKNAEWMSEQTKAKAYKKLERLKFKIGYPKKFKDYSSIKIDRNDLFGNFCRAMELEISRRMKRVGKKVDVEEWDMLPHTVNAYYDPSNNQMVLPAGILQPPFFDTAKDEAVNYGGIGGIVGHELTHGYDDQGRLYDWNGKLRDWWGEKDAKLFREKARKVEQLYSKFTIIDSIKVNGKLTLGENIADLGGISIAFDALEKYLTRHPEANRRIEGFTPQQRFFIAWSQAWRENVLPKAAKVYAKVDVHAPGKIRGLVPVITHPAFAKVFMEKSMRKHIRLPHHKIGIW
jgi:putative endopeptidase